MYLEQLKAACVHDSLLRWSQLPNNLKILASLGKLENAFLLLNS